MHTQPLTILFFVLFSHHFYHQRVSLGTTLWADRHTLFMVLNLRFHYRRSGNEYQDIDPYVLCTDCHCDTVTPKTPSKAMFPTSYNTCDRSSFLSTAPLPLSFQKRGNSSEHPLPSQFYLSRCLSGLEPSLGDTDPLTFGQLGLVFVQRPRARAVVWVVNASCLFVIDPIVSPCSYFKVPFPSSPTPT